MQFNKYTYIHTYIHTYISLSVFAPENLVSRDGFGSPVPLQPAHLHTQAEPGAYLQDSSRVPRRRPFMYLKPPYAIGSFPSLSGHAIAYRWRSLSRVRRHRPSKPQGSSERVLPWQVTMDQLICCCCCCCCLHIKTVLTSIQYPSLSSSSRQRNGFPWSQANPK